MRTDTPVQIKLSDYTAFPFEIPQIDLRFELNPSATRVISQLNIKRRAVGDLVLDGINLKLESIKINGQTLASERYRIDQTSLTIWETPDSFTLEIAVEIDPSANTALSGLYLSGGRFCTQCESTGFRRITYWPDRPDVMSRFKVYVDADKSTFPILLSNGTPGESGDLPEGRHFMIWEDPHPKPSYLFALCAGSYDVYRDTFTTMEGTEVDLAVHVDHGDAPRAAWAMESLKAAMKWDEDVFLRAYDLGVFNIVAVRDFNFGAMENKGLNVFNSAYVLADESTATDADFEAIESIVGHEYFHNWTGNRITCRDWFQLCLKEGLTVFRDQEFSANMRSRPVQRIKDVIRLRSHQFTEDGGPLAHAVRPDHYGSIDNLYTATVYEKGAELIRMLKTLIGEDAFGKGMQLYFSRHDGQATTIEHFYACFEETSGYDLEDFRRWYSQPGTPTLEVSEDWNGRTGHLTTRLVQSNPITPGNNSPRPLPMPIKIAAFSQSGRKLDDTTLILEGPATEWVVRSDEGRPLLSINREFSAPVRLRHHVPAETTLSLARVDDDRFTQWDSFQKLIKANLLEMAYGDKIGPDTTLISTLSDAVRQGTDDPAYAALLTRLPEVGEMFLEHTPAQPDKLARARSQMQKSLATELAADIPRFLSEPQNAPFRPDARQAGQRALKAAMIALLGARGTLEDRKNLKQAFDDAPNMTLSLATLRALCVSGGTEKTDSLEAFQSRWHNNELVMDKWFAVQAATGSVADVEILTRHPRFDLTNPNRVRAVIGVFSMQNLAEFHSPTGKGHALVCDMVAAADKLNPALAARLLQAFEHWQALDLNSQKSALASLEQLRRTKLSKNATDIISRTLSHTDS